MNERKPPQTDEEFLQALADLLEEVELDPPEDVEAELREFGYDPKALTARMRAVVGRALAESPLNWRNRTREMEEAQSFLANPSSARPARREDMIAGIKQMVSQLCQGKFQPVYYRELRDRNLEETSDDDLASLFADLQYLLGQSEGNESSGG